MWLTNFVMSHCGVGYISVSHCQNININITLTLLKLILILLNIIKS